MLEVLWDCQVGGVEGDWNGRHQRFLQQYHPVLQWQQFILGRDSMTKLVAD